jgi:hypothetical protein
MGEERKVYRVLVGNPKRNTRPRRPRHIWEDGISVYLRDWRGEWIHLAQDRDQWQALINAVMNLQVLTPQS